MKRKRRSRALASGLDEALRNVEDGADPVWMEQVGEIVRGIARRKETFTTDDVWEVVRARDTLSSSQEPRALGAIMCGMAREGIIESTGYYRKSTDPRCHSRPKAVWHSLVYKK